MALLFSFCPVCDCEAPRTDDGVCLWCALENGVRCWACGRCDRPAACEVCHE